MTKKNQMQHSWNWNRSNRKVLSITISLACLSMSVMVMKGPFDLIYRDAVFDKFISDEPVASWGIDGLDWNKTWAGGSNDVFYGTWAYGDYIYTCGVTESKGAGGTDLLLVKWDTNGNEVWNKTWGYAENDGGNAVWVSTSSVIFTVGTTYHPGMSDLVLIRWDDNGNQVWNKTWGGAQSEDGNSVFGDGTYVYTCGSTSSYGNGNFDVCLIKWDYNGNVQGSYMWGGANQDNGYCVRMMGGYVYICGQTTSFSVGGKDALLLKYTTNGVLEWNRSYGTAYDDCLYALTYSGTSVYCTGYTSGPTTGFDVLLVSWTSSGVQSWVRTWGGASSDIGYGISFLGVYFFVTGFTQSFGFPCENLFFMKWTYAGTQLWNRTWAGVYGTGAQGRASAWGGLDVYVGGNTYSDGCLMKWNSSGSVPVADFEANATSIIAGQSVAFSYNGTFGDGAHTYTWDFGDSTPTSNLAAPIHPYTAPGTYTVQLTIEDVDSDDSVETKVDYITVGANYLPVADFEANATTIIAGQHVQFTYNGTAGNGLVSYEWDFHDTTLNATDAGPVHPFTTPGLYDVTLTVRDVDGDYSTKSWPDCITVLEDTAPAADFTTNSTSVIAGQAVAFTYNGTAGNGIVSYEWDFGDGTGNETSANPVHVYAASGLYNVTVTVEDSNGNASTAFKVNFMTVIDDVQPVADFTMNETSILHGRSVAFIYNGTTGNGGESYQWSFGDGSVNATIANPVHVFNVAGTFSITVTVTDVDGDGSTTSKVDAIIVILDTVPVADFTMNVTDISENEAIQFTYSGTAGNGIVSYQWNFGDGTANQTIANPVHVFSQAGSYTVTLTVVDADGDASTHRFSSVMVASSGGPVISGMPFTFAILFTVTGLVLVMHKRVFHVKRDS